MNLIKEIKEKLKKYPELTFEEAENEITVLAKDLSGFDVTLWCDDREIIVFFEGWHQHFARAYEDEALNCFAMGLSDSCRLTVFSRAGKDYRWTLHVLDLETNKWIFSGTTLVFHLIKFWKKKQTRSLQNSIIKIDSEQIA